MLTRTLVGALVGLTACSTAGPHAGQPTSSTTMAPLRGSGWLVTANGVENSVSLLSTHPRRASTLLLEGEPSRVATDGDRVWVTLRASNEVVELSARATGLEVVARATVGAEPVGIVLHPDGSRLYVAESIDHRVVELDADTLAPLRRFDLPGEARWLALHPSGVLYTVGPDQPVIHYLDVEEDAPAVERLPLIDLGGDGRRATGDPAMSSSGHDLVIPAVEIDDPNLGAPLYYTPAFSDGGIIAPSLQFFDLDVFTGLPTGPARERVLDVPSYASSVTWDRGQGVATLPGAAGVLRVASWGPRQEWIEVGAGPMGVAIADDGAAWVHELFDVSATDLEVPMTPLPLGSSRLPLRVREGRSLFYSSTDPSMTTGGISCASCHVEGRSDNRTWELDSGAWQTPSLAGGIAVTAPVSWAQEVPSVAEEAALTSERRMGGDGSADYAALAAYIETIRRPNPPTATVSTEVLALGALAFAKAQCSLCHPAPLFTDNRTHHDLFGRDVSVQTPSLRGLASTAPYYHDGRAPTLDHLLQMAEGSMGVPEILHEDEREALMHYLRSL